MSKNAFTIVELLVVIVVIGILASITTVAYSGITKKAVTSAIYSDLSNDSNVLKQYNAEYGFYPTAFDANNCASAPIADLKYCLRASSGNTIAYAGGVQNFALSSTNLSSNISYRIPESGGFVANVASYVYVWGKASDDSGTSIAQAHDGGYVTNGHTDSFGAGGIDALISKYTADGALEWNKTWGSAGTDYSSSITQSSDGGYVMNGFTDISGTSDSYLAKFNPNGTLAWNKTWGGSDFDMGIAAIQTTDGGYASIGVTNSFGAGNGDVFLAKQTSDGTLSWSKTWGGAYDDSPAAVVQTSDGGYAIAGSTSTFGTNDMFIAKFSSNGTFLWNKTWGGASFESGEAITELPDGGLIVVGETMSYGVGDVDVFVVKFAADGTFLWNKTWGGTNSELVRGIAKTSDGGFVMTGGVGSFGANDSNDFYIAKYASDGTLSWSKTWGGTGNENGFSVVNSLDLGYTVFGSTDSFGSGSNDMALVKFSSNGSVVGCPAANCKSITATVTTPSANITIPAATITSPSATTTVPTATITTPTATYTKLY